MARYVAAVDALSLGDPHGSVDMGPLASEAQLAKANAAIATAIDEGSTNSRPAEHRRPPTPKAGTGSGRRSLSTSIPR